MAKLTKTAARKITHRIDRVANYFEHNFADMGYDPKVANEILWELDKVSEMVERQAGGEIEDDMREETKGRDTELEHEPDESYMETFHSPSGVHQQDADEEYMAAFEDSNFDGVRNYIEKDRQASNSNWYENERAQRRASARRDQGRREDNWYTRGE